MFTVGMALLDVSQKRRTLLGLSLPCLMLSSLSTISTDWTDRRKDISHIFHGLRVRSHWNRHVGFEVLCF